MIKLHKDFLINELNLPDSAIKDTIVDTSRWSEHHEIILAHDGKFYKTYYSQGLTENAWDNEEEVECYEVELVERKVKIWEVK